MSLNQRRQNSNWVDTDLIYLILAIAYDNENWKESRINDVYLSFRDEEAGYASFGGSLLKFVQNGKTRIPENVFNNLDTYVITQNITPENILELVESPQYKEAFKQIYNFTMKRLSVRSRGQYCTYPIYHPPENNRSVLVIDRNPDNLTVVAACCKYQDGKWFGVATGDELSIHHDSYWFDIPH